MPLDLSSADRAILSAIFTAPKPVRLIVEPHNYGDGEGREVTHNVVVQGEMPQDFVSFVGHFTVPVPVARRMPDGSVQQFIEDSPLSIKLPAKDLNEAFDMFDNLAKETAERYLGELKAHALRSTLASGAGVNLSK